MRCPFPLHCLLLIVLTLMARPVQAQETPAFVWLEGEKTTAINVKPNVAGWGRKEFLSDEKWLHVSIEENKVDTEVPAEGVTLRYEFDVAKAGTYQVWDRIGFEFVRSPFAWRIDNGAWKTVTPETLTTDLMAIETWTEVAWLQLGEANLAAGKHTLEIKVEKTKDDKGKTQRILYASDALCLVAGKFIPNSKFKPNETGRTEADVAAEKNVFVLPAPAEGNGLRVALPLKGDWAVCRNDENLPPPDIAVPMQDFPQTPIWRAIAVPSDKNVARPDLTFAHRLWYRTRIDIPKTHAGRAFTLTFPRNSLNTTVYVNGVYCGFNKNPNAPFTLDVTKGVKPGQVNEVWVGIRDAWYAYSNNPKDPMKLRKQFNIPLSFVGNGFQRLAYPVWHAWESGIVQTPMLQSVGRVYASDVFVKPSVAKKELAAEITLTNSTATAVTTQVTVEAVDAKTGNVAKTFPTFPVTVAGGETKTVPFSSAWPDVKFWWPEPNPQLYRLRVALKRDAMPFDVSETTFGFREWGAKGKDFTLNGIVWHGWADLNTGETAQEFLANYRKANQRFFRLMGYAQGGPNWRGLTPTDALDFADANGMVVRRSGDLDGEAIGYMAIEEDPDLKALYKSEVKMDLMNNWIDQMVQQVKAERNHPSIHLWSVENEWLYINCINLYGGMMDEFEAVVKRCIDAVMQTDPTRLAMVDGGGAGKDQLYPVHGDHYVFEANNPGKYPAFAYEPNVTGGGRGRWVWDQKRPRYLAEDYFANGINPFDYAYFGGEETFIGKANTRKAAGWIQRMLTEGYRWAEFGAYHFWLGSESAVNQYQAFADLAVFVREWDSTFTTNQAVVRNCAIFNDQFYDNSPITFKATLTIGGKSTVTDTQTFTVPPGTNQKFRTQFVTPGWNKGRVEGTWTLTLTQDGKEKFRDVRLITLLPRDTILKQRMATARQMSPEANRTAEVLIDPEPLPGTNFAPAGAKTDVALRLNLSKQSNKATQPAPLVYDPQGDVANYLKTRGIVFQPVKSLNGLPNATLLIIGRDALTMEESTSSKLAAWASFGRRIVVLEQKNPLKYQAIPATMEASVNEGRTAFIEDESHPVFRNLKNSDFFTWANGEVVYRNAYEKPTLGAKSLLQCDSRLSKTAIVEIPTGRGLLLLCQARVGEVLTKNVVAEQLFQNLVTYATNYKQEFRPVIVASAPDIKSVLQASGVQFTEATNLFQALKPGAIAVVEATSANLKTLANSKAALDTFHKSGGWLMLVGLTPEGLADYNKIVGVNHMIRPFRRERVTFPAKKNPLMAGLSNADIVLSSGQRINGYSDDVYMASDVFTYVIDFDDVAPFAKLPEPSYWGYSDAGNDHNPYNMVNGFNSSDSWQLIFSIWAGEGGKPEVPMPLSEEQTLTEVEWQGNAFYYPTKQFEIVTESGTKAVFNPVPNNEPQTFSINPPLTGKDFLVKITGWVPAKEPSIVGIDNIRLKAKRTPEYYKTVHPLLNIGAMMRYDRDKGGIVLCNLKFQETEAVPENKRKKQNIFATLLRNLKAPVGGSATVIPGAALAYTPIDIGKFATQYRDEKGWFGDKAFTFRDMPTGKQTFAGITFDIYQFATSPVPNAVMLKGDGIPGNLPDAVRGIPVGTKADALFFLHTARIDRRRNEQEIREKKQYEMARYIITYADGQKVTVPIYAEQDIENYRQETPRPIPGAQIAWVRKYEGTPDSAVAYVKQWNNPRPSVTIQSVDLEYGNDRRGVPALLALTAATAAK